MTADDIIDFILQRKVFYVNSFIFTPHEWDLYGFTPERFIIVSGSLLELSFDIVSDEDGFLSSTSSSFLHLVSSNGIQTILSLIWDFGFSFFLFQNCSPLFFEAQFY